jgi:hypothetical protein
MDEPDAFKLEDHHLLVQALKICSFLDESGERIGAPAAIITATRTLTVTFKGTLAVLDRGNPGASDYEANKEAREALITGLRKVVNNYLRHNDAVSELDLTAMGLRIWKKNRSPKTAAKTHPEGELTNDEPGHLKGRFHDEGSDRIGIAKGSDILEISIEYDRGDGSVNVWHEIFHTARPEFSLPPEFCNRLCRAKARWRNNNDQKGLWSNPFNVYVVLLEELKTAAPKPEVNGKDLGECAERIVPLP